MPKLSTSDRAKARLRQLLRGLLTYVNHELDGDVIDNINLTAKLQVKWQGEAGEPRLLVQTTLTALGALLFDEAVSAKTKEQLRHDLRLLKEYLKILEDHRLKTQGTENWHFTLRLWSRSTDRNLEAFERAWEQQKSLKSTQSAPASQPEWLSSKPTATQKVLHNLPVRSHSAYVGAQTALAKLFLLLAKEHPASLISIEGAAGVGKTTLALEVAHRCCRTKPAPTSPDLPTFNAIIFVSAKPEHFLGNRLTQRLKIESNLHSMLRVIYRTLEILDMMPAELEQQIAVVQAYLAQQSTLLIVDNLETIETQSAVLSFLSELPATVKVLLTSRIRLGIGTAISLGCLSLEDGMALVQHYAQEKDVLINSAEAEVICHQSGGLPLAIAYSMGYIAICGIIPHALRSWLAEAGSDFVQYCFAASVQQIRNQPAHAQLMGLALFAQSASRAALQAVALVQADEAEAGLSLLHQLSLVEVRQEYYDLHPLTRSYVNVELQLHPEFEQLARDRLITWYLSFLNPYAQENWREWQEFACLEQEWENIYEVTEWCKAQARYDDFKQFWQQLKGYTQFQGHWQVRLNWLDWLMAAARSREDWSTFADALYHLSRTLYLFNQPEQSQRAVEAWQQAWELSQSQGNLGFQVELIIHRAALCSQQQQVASAKRWLDQGVELLHQHEGIQDNAYQWVDLDYYRAELCRQHRDYLSAKQLYARALQRAETLGWQRATAYIKGWLAAVAIAQGEWAEAETLLKFVWLQASEHQDKRCLSFCETYWALLEQQRGNLTAAENWTASARAGFEQLEMWPQ